MARRTLPATASVAHPLEADKLYAPAADRNADALVSLLMDAAPGSGTALELASGTGQHIVAFARAMPQLTWQPTEVAQDRLASISAYASGAELANLKAPHMLNATQPGWGEARSVDLIVLINLLHLIRTDEARTVITEAAHALKPEGCFVLYGPFMRDGALTSEGDSRFHASLTASDPMIGYKDVGIVTGWMRAEGLRVKIHEMPANNLAISGRVGSS